MAVVGCGARVTPARVDGGLTTCDGLGIDACRQTAGCSTDVCAGCSCADVPAYLGCRRSIDTVRTCPDAGCATPSCCGNGIACSGAGLCAPVGTRLNACSGACDARRSSCSKDTECQTGEICGLRDCACSDQTVCRPACSASKPCRVGETCDAELHRCLPMYCNGSGQCPAFSECGGHGTCLSISCRTDSDCAAGFCIWSTCQAALGECVTPAP